METISLIFFILALLFGCILFLIPLIALPGFAELLLYYFIKTGTFESSVILGNEHWTNAVILSLAISATLVHALWIFSYFKQTKPG